MPCVYVQVLFYVHPDKAQQLTKGPMAEAKPKVRIVNHPESTVQIRSMKASAIGRLVTVTGTVVRIGAVRPQITQMDFICNKCSFSSTCLFEEGRYTPPTACPAEGCRSKSFDPLRSSAHSIDWQKIRVQVPRPSLKFLFCWCTRFCEHAHTRLFLSKISTQQSNAIKVSNFLQELQNAHRDSGGQVPRTIEVELKEDLVDSCTAGDVVTVVGIVKVVNTEIMPGMLHPVSQMKKCVCITVQRGRLMGCTIIVEQVPVRQRMQRRYFCSTWMLSPSPPSAAPPHGLHKRKMGTSSAPHIFRMHSCF